MIDLTSRQALVLMTIAENGNPYDHFRRVRWDTMAKLMNTGMIEANPNAVATASVWAPYRATDKGREWLRYNILAYGVSLERWEAIKEQPR